MMRLHTPHARAGPRGTARRRAPSSVSACVAAGGGLDWPRYGRIERHRARGSTNGALTGKRCSRRSSGISPFATTSTPATARGADLAQFFTDDAVFIDPAWGRVEGIEEMKATVFGDAMVGLEEWTFPTEFYMIDGDTVVVKWQQVLPGRAADGRPYAAVGLLDARLRGRRQVLLRGRPAQHGARVRGHDGERLPVPAGHGMPPEAPEPRLLPPRCRRAPSWTTLRETPRLRRDLPAAGGLRRRGDAARRGPSSTTLFLPTRRSRSTPSRARRSSSSAPPAGRRLHRGRDRALRVLRARDPQRRT